MRADYKKISWSIFTKKKKEGARSYNYIDYKTEKQTFSLEFKMPIWEMHRSQHSLRDSGFIRNEMKNTNTAQLFMNSKFNIPKEIQYWIIGGYFRPKKAFPPNSMLLNREGIIFYRRKSWEGNKFWNLPRSDLLNEEESVRHWFYHRMRGAFPQKRSKIMRRIEDKIIFPQEGGHSKKQHWANIHMQAGSRKGELFR